MNNYEFRVGDYVETVDGRVGCMRNFKERKDGTFICSVWYSNDLVIHQGYMVGIPSNFKRIGKYTFQSKTKPEKIEKLKCSEVMNSPLDSATDAVLYTKINEIIAYINKQEE